MKGVIIKKIGPYSGPFEKNLITYKIKLENKNIITWHENGKRNFPNLKQGDIVDGIYANNHLFSYQKSKIKHINKQLELL